MGPLLTFVTFQHFQAFPRKLNEVPRHEPGTRKEVTMFPENVEGRTATEYGVDFDDFGLSLAELLG